MITKLEISKQLALGGVRGVFKRKEAAIHLVLHRGYCDLNQLIAGESGRSVCKVCVFKPSSEECNEQISGSSCYPEGALKYAKEFLERKYPEVLVELYL